MKRQLIRAEGAPDNTGINAGNFSQAARVGDTVYIGGTLAIDQQAQAVVDDNAASAFHRAYQNLQLICREAGGELDDIVMLTALLTDLADLETLNDVQAEYFTAPHPPRSTLKVAGLPHGRIELTAVVVIGSGDASN